VAGGFEGKAAGNFKAYRVDAYFVQREELRGLQDFAAGSYAR
jgi:hypothetical protein